MHLVTLLTLLAACGQPTHAPDQSSSTPAEARSEARAGVTDVAGLKAAMDAGPITLVDVRTPTEFAAGHVPGAQPLPLSDLETRLAELESHKDGDVYLICASGGRSGRAAQLLEREGFRHPINVEGGTRAWVAAGHPIDTP